MAPIYLELEAKHIHVDDFGTDFIVTLKEDTAVLDVSTFTGFYLRFEKPSGTTVEKAAAMVAGGTDGRIHYVFESGLVDETGRWKVQARIVKNTTAQFHSEIKEFTVLPNIEVTAP